MAKIHCTSVVDPRAKLAEDVTIGPFCHIEGDVVIGSGTQLESHVIVKLGTIIGSDNYIAEGVVLGGMPQDRKYRHDPTFLEIGDNNIIREYVTITRATQPGASTRVGSHCYIMAYTHVGHDCVVGDYVTLTNGVGVSGHVHIEDHAFIGGMVGIHQYVHVGRLAMVGGMSRIVRDVPPYMIVEGEEQKVYDINAIALRRLGVSRESRMALHKACKIMFKSRLALGHAIEIVRREVEQTQEVQDLLLYAERLYQGKLGRWRQV